mgnify:CR=1 FL=1
MILRLWWEFFKIGLFSVGGGMATLPFLYDLSDRTGWFTHQQIADMLAVSESTPGPIGINMATYTGYTSGGIFGSIAATIGMITPGIIIVLLVVAVLDRFRKNKYVESAFYGLRPASAGLIAAAGALVFKIVLFDFELFGQSGSVADLFNFKAIVMAVILFILIRYCKPTKKLHPIVFIAASAAVGILIF